MATSTIISTPRVNKITGAVISAAMKVHSHFGPGLIESAYEACLAYELRKQGLEVARQVELPVIYDGERIDLGYCIDLVVEGLVVVEIKCVDAIHPAQQAQLLSCIRLSGRHIGLLINFHVAHLRATASSAWSTATIGKNEIPPVFSVPSVVIRF
jgi:GxxExxY protein